MLYYTRKSLFHTEAESVLSRVSQRRMRGGFVIVRLNYVVFFTQSSLGFKAL